MITVRRERAQAPQFAAAVEAVRRSAEALVDRPMLVPDEGVAGWNHQYICPDHGVMLAFDWESPHRHRCPVDGALHEGPLLDAAWWRQLNTQWADGAFAMGVTWQLTGEERFFEQTRQVLLAYARRYPGYEVHGGIPFNGPGKANAQTICDANCLIALALAFDLVRQGLSSEEARVIQEDLLKCGARFLLEHHERQIHNHQCWIAAAIGIIGLVVGNDEWVEYGVNGPFGLAQQLREGVGEDGFWLEGSVGYHLYALRPLTRFAALARGTRWDISGAPALRAMYRALRPMTLPDGAYPHINDVVAVQKPAALVPMLETAYGWDGDPELG
ncbi:MAG TPA: alginate lyase family protein, partial [Symbiobacteriaceae bacterium]|nr:alginate lyase family protein [Symbiobacteriaceae bacterium]